MGISACREAGQWEVAVALLHSAARNIELFRMLGDTLKQSKGDIAAMYICMYVYIYIHEDRYTYIHIYIYTYMYMYMYVNMFVCM